MLDAFRFSAAALPIAVVMALTAPARHPRAADPQPYPMLQPGSPDISTGEMKSSVARYRLMHRAATDSVESEIGTQALFETPVPGSAHEMTSRVLSYRNGQLAATDTFSYDGATLRPISEHSHFGQRTLDITYDGPKVTWSLQLPDSALKSATQSFPVNVFAFFQVEQIVRFMPHRDGVGYILPLYSEGDRNIEYDTVAVTGRGNNGTWIVRFGDPTIVQTYEVDDASQSIVKHEVVNRKRGDHFRYLFATE